ncbi:hypothetical protein bcere0026_20830 [Bacillus mycoides]|uniref:Uncharacterized protein n=1 Tax=Bacillus mycoides TaxID=1405 RepID=C2XTR3_BACMY|nr:hypothetical protein bcere0026_20830 [Bacillus mycoides]
MIEKEDVQSESAYFGNVLEEVVAKEISKRTGFKGTTQKCNPAAS